MTDHQSKWGGVYLLGAWLISAQATLSLAETPAVLDQGQRAETLLESDLEFSDTWDELRTDNAIASPTSVTDVLEKSLYRKVSAFQSTRPDDDEVSYVAQQPRSPIRRLPPSESPSSSTRNGRSPFSTNPRSLSSLGRRRSSFSDRLASFRTKTPVITGDLFGSASRTVTVTDTVTNSFHTYGNIVSGSPGSSAAVLAFEQDGIPPFNDFTTVGTGTDASGDGQADTFNMTEPLPPNDVPTSPGPGFVYDGGTVVYTNSPVETTAQDGQFMDGELWYAEYSFSNEITVEIPGNSGAVRRVKIAENNSPEPRDRLYFDYRFFKDVVGRFGDVNRYTFGFEKTFYDQLMSVDVRVPFAATLSNEQVVPGTLVRDIQFGNLAVVFKGALYFTETFLFSGGMGVGIPSGQDALVYMSDGRQFLAIENDSVHVLPFFAGLWAPNECYYLQGFWQLDLDTNGNPIRGGMDGGILPEIGRLQDSNLMFLDLSGGYYVYESSDSRAVIQRIAAITELHYTTTVQDADIVTAPGITITDTTRRLDVLNWGAGLNFDVGEQHTITSAFLFPLRDGDDGQFDYELSVIANWYF